MKKYGTEHFHIFLLEECSIKDLSEREKYWIEKYNTYCDGYNATKGGDGKMILDYNSVIEEYKKCKDTIKVAKLLHCSKYEVRNILHSNNIEITYDTINYEILNKPKRIKQYSLDNKFLKEFSTVTEAAKYLFEAHLIKKYSSGVRGHIADCANGKTKTAYGFKWKY